MHNIEPFYHWRELYSSEEDKKSPFYGRSYSEFSYTHKIYNYYIHPQWDPFGSSTLYLKILYADYEEGFCVMELIGEWNDCIENDIMYLKRDVIDLLIHQGITKFIIICENVLNFHGSDDCYYEEWKEDIEESDGWVCLINLLNHVQDEMKRTFIHHHVNLGKNLNEVHWRKLNPQMLFELIQTKI